MLVKCALVVASFFLCVGVVSAEQKTEFYVLTDADIAMVERGVAEKLLDPESARFTQLIAATEPPPDPSKPEEYMIWVCGHVSGKNTFGGYAQPTPFLGAIFPQKSLFMAINVAGPSPNEQMATLNTCLSKMPKK